MIVRVLRRLGVPDDLLAVYDFTVYHRADLSVASARIETDAAAFQISAHAERTIFLLGNFILFQPHDFKGLFINAAHEIDVERARSVRRIRLFQALVNLFAPRNGDFITAHDP